MPSVQLAGGSVEFVWRCCPTAWLFVANVCCSINSFRQDDYAAIFAADGGFFSVALAWEMVAHDIWK